MVEPKPSLLEDYWHLGDPWFDCVRIFKNSYQVCHEGTLVSFDSLPYCAILGRSKDKTWPSHINIVDVRSLKPILVLPGVYLAFKSEEKIVCLQIVDGDSTGRTLQRRVVSIDPSKLSESDYLPETYSIGFLDKSSSKEVDFATNYTSCCDFGQKNSLVKVLYCNNQGHCRAILKKDDKFSDQAATLKLSLSSNLDQNIVYFFDMASKVAVIQLDSLRMYVLGVTLSLEGSQVVCYTSSLESLDLRSLFVGSPLSSMNYAWQTRDPGQMAFISLPLPLFQGSKIVEFSKRNVDEDLRSNSDNLVGSLYVLKCVDYQIQDSIIGLCSSGDYSTLLTEKVDGTKRFVITKRSPEPSVISKLNADKYSSLGYNGQVLLLQNRKYQSAQLASLPLDYTMYPDTTEIPIQANTFRASSSMYGYLRAPKIEVRNIENDLLVYSFDTSMISSRYSQYELDINSISFVEISSMHLLSLSKKTKKNSLTVVDS